MRIIHLIDYFQPKVGYQEYFLALEHQKLGHDIRVITSNYYFPFVNYDQVYKKILGSRKVEAGERKEEGVEVLRLASVEIVRGSLLWMNGLASALEEFHPDLVFCHNIFSLTSLLAAYLKHNLGYKLFYDTHVSPFNTNFSNTLPKIIYRQLFQIFAIPKIKTQADVILAIGEEEKKFVCNEFHIANEKVPILRLGVNDELFSFSRQKRERMRNKLGLKERDVLLLFAGKITVNKDVHILLKAVKEMSNRMVKLLLIGGGDNDYIRLLNKILSDKRIIFLPFIENKSLSKFYCAADIGIWPGDPSVTMLEAMSCKLPLVLPTENETKYLDDSNAILRFERANSNDLAEKLEFLIENSNYRKKAAENAIKYAKNELSWKKMAIKVIKMANNIHYEYNT